jgi:MFS family permease
LVHSAWNSAILYGEILVVVNHSVGSVFTEDLAKRRNQTKDEGKSVSLASAWEPLREPVFRALWIAAVVSNIGTWMEDVGEAWLMTSLTASPLMVALVETAGSLPVVLLSVPSGAFADLIDRRRLLLITQAWMLIVAATLGILTIAGLTTPWILLTLAFALGLGAAVNSPAWEAITPELVTREELPAAVTLGAVAFNVARALGPAVGGLLVAALGPGPVFLLNAVSFLGVISVLYRWKRRVEKSNLPAEHVLGAIRAGVRYVRHTPALQAVLVRAAAFILCASALWALLPLVARRELGFTAAGYGVLLGCLGLGGVTGASILPRVRQEISINSLVVGATLTFAVVMIILAYVRIPIVVGGSLIFGGIAWMSLLSTFNVAAQTATAGWVRARVIGVYMLSFFGGWAIGSAVWGWVAGHVGISKTLMIAGAGLVVGLATGFRFKLRSGEDLDLRPSAHWPEPKVQAPLEDLTGSVLVTIEYRIDPKDAPAFIEAAQASGEIKRRDGAVYWNLFHDTVDDARYVETFIVDSWAEHLRQHSRLTQADRVVDERVRSFHRGPSPAKISHLIAEG